MQGCPFLFPLSLMRYLGSYKTATNHTNKFNSETKIFKTIVLCELCVSLVWWFPSGNDTIDSCSRANDEP